MLNHKWQWKEDGIFNEEPFHQLTGPMVKVGKLCYFVVGALQLVVMAMFSQRYTPDWNQCSSGDCGLNDTNTSSLSDLHVAKRTEQAEYPSWLWLIWAAVLLLYNGHMLISVILSKVHDARSKLRQRTKAPSSTEKYKAPVPTSLDVRLAIVDRLPPIGFALGTFIWFHAHRSWLDYDYNQVTSIVFLLGWTSGFMLLGDTFSWIHKFTKIFKEMIVTDVLLAATATFPYLLTGFSSATNALRSPAGNSSATDASEGSLQSVLTTQNTGESSEDATDTFSRSVTLQSPENKDGPRHGLTDVHIYILDTIPPVHVVSSYVDTDICYDVTLLFRI